MMTVLCLAISSKAFGQFNTISNSFRHHINVVPVSHGSSCDSNAMETQNENTPPVTSVIDGVRIYAPTEGKVVEMDMDSMKSELIKRYLGVSYPLSHIEVTSQFGMRKHPVFRKKMKHDGIDLRARYEEVYSVMDGEVTAVGSDKRSGRYVVVQYPGGYSCSYCHLSQPLVKRGDFVKAGEVIAISGNSGTSTGAHLHFGVRDAAGKGLDPMVILEFIRKTREDVVRGLRELHNREPMAS